MHLGKIIVGAFCLFFLSPLWADSNSDLINDLSPYQQTSGQFTQKIMDSNHVLLQTNSGSFSLERPLNANSQGKFLWDTQAPQKQTLIADGQNISFYDPALKQVTVKKQKNAMHSNSPAMLLAGNIQSITKNYHVQKETSGTRTIYSLTPRSDGMFSELKIIFNDTKELSEMIVKDKLDQTTDISFTNLQQKVDAKSFKWHLPADVDVVNGD